MNTSPVGPLDALWHLLNFLAPAVGVAAIASGGVKLCWRTALRTTRWWRLFYPAAIGGCATLVTGLIVWGRDGRMSTYGLLVLVISVCLWWRLPASKGATASGAPS